MNVLPNMVRLVELWLSFPPVAKARPRVNSDHAYTPSPTAAAERILRQAARAECGEGWNPVTGPLRLVIDVVRPRPAVLPGRQRLHRLPDQRPDLDNYIKLLIDALSPSRRDPWGIWLDDAQIVEIVARKRYAESGRVGWHVVVEALAGSSPCLAPSLTTSARATLASTDQPMQQEDCDVQRH